MLPVRSVLDDLTVSDTSMTESAAEEGSPPVPRRKPKLPPKPTPEPRPRTTIEEPFYCMRPIPRRHKSYEKEFRKNYNTLKRDYKEFKKNIPQTLSGYMPSIPDIVEDPKKLPPGSTLSSLSKWCPVENLIIKPLGELDLEAFRLHPGPLPDKLKEVGAKISDVSPSCSSNTQTGSAAQSQATGAIPKKPKRDDAKKAGIKARKKKATKK